MPIEEVKRGDEVLSYDVERGEFTCDEVQSVWSGPRRNVYWINNSICATWTHPFWTREAGWASVNPIATLREHKWRPAQLEIQQHVLGIDGTWIQINSIDPVPGEYQVFNLVGLGTHRSYFAADLLVHNKDDATVEITEVQLPNGFLAVPDPAIYIETHGNVVQTAENDVTVTYKCKSSPCACGTGANRIELWVEGGGDSERVSTANIAAPTADPQTVTVRLSSNVQRFASPVYKLKIVSTCGDSDEHEVTATPLIYNIDFAPRAHIPQPDGTLPGPDPMCPYTHHHTAIVPDRPTEDWYGLSLTFNVHVDLQDSFEIRVSGGDMGGTKILSWPDGIRHVNCNPGLLDCRRVKWEGYNASLMEDALFPTVYFPSGMHWAPTYIVKEGEYDFALTGIADGEKFQRHAISGLKTYVQYDVAADVIDCAF